MVTEHLTTKRAESFSPRATRREKWTRKITLQQAEIPTASVGQTKLVRECLISLHDKKLFRNRNLNIWRYHSITRREKSLCSEFKLSGNSSSVTKTQIKIVPESLFF